MSLTWSVGVNWGIMMPVVVSTTVFLAVFAVCVVTYCWCKLRDQISSYETRQRMPDFRTGLAVYKTPGPSLSDCLQPFLERSAG